MSAPTTSTTQAASAITVTEQSSSGVPIAATYVPAQPWEFSVTFTGELLEAYFEEIKKALEETLIARPSPAEPCNVVAMHLVNPQWDEPTNDSASVRVGSAHTTLEHRQSFMEQLREALVPRGIRLTFEAASSDEEHAAPAC